MTTINAKHDDSRMTLLYLVSRDFNEHLDLDRTIRRVLIATSRVVGAPHGSFFLFDDHENLIKRAAPSSSSPTKTTTSSNHC
jgi:hypothetical protein